MTTASDLPRVTLSFVPVNVVFDLLQTSFLRFFEFSPHLVWLSACQLGLGTAFFNTDLSLPRLGLQWIYLSLPTPYHPSYYAQQNNQRLAY